MAKEKIYKVTVIDASGWRKTFTLLATSKSGAIKRAKAGCPGAREVCARLEFGQN